MIFDPIFLGTAAAATAVVGAVYLYLHHPAVKATVAAVLTPAPTPAVAAPVATAIAKVVPPVSISSDIAAFVADAEKDAASAETFISSEAAAALSAAKTAAETAYNDLKATYDADVAALKAVITSLRAKLAPAVVEPATPAKPAGAPGQG